jgi:hypothetical protein
MLAGNADNIEVPNVSVVILGPVCRQAGLTRGSIAFKKMDSG